MIMRRVGIVGCGGIAGVHTWALKQIEGCRICALCDVVPERAKQLAGICGVSEEAVFCDFDRMLEDAKMDVLHVCTPHYLHVPMAVKALEAGISVFMEKPAAMNEKQLMQLKHACESSAAHLGVCFQNRYNKSTAEIDKIVHSGELGEVIGGRAFVTWRRDGDYYAAADWKGKWETEGGGVLINQAIHTLDLLLRYLGEPTRVEASLHNHHTEAEIEVEDTVEAWMEFGGGKRACFYASNGYVTDAPVILELQCEKGRITLQEQTVLVSDNRQVRLIECKELEGIGKSYWGSGHLACIRDFYSCLDSGEDYSNDIAHVMSTMETTIKIYEKGRNTKWNR